jgi:hypothetical protein
MLVCFVFTPAAERRSTESGTERFNTRCQMQVARGASVQRESRQQVAGTQQLTPRRWSVSSLSAAALCHHTRPRCGKARNVVRL